MPRIGGCDLTLWMKRSSRRPRFPGLHLSANDRAFLVDQTRDGRAVAARTWKRIRILELLHEASWLAEVAEAIGTYPREVRRVGWRYLDQGVQAALTDEPRPKPSKLLDTRQQAAIVARVCGPPPAGYARWTVPVTTVETKRRVDCRRRLARDHSAGLGPPRAEAVAENVARPDAGR